ncbi:GSCFA domain-containing protein [Chitinophaga lutea]
MKLRLTFPVPPLEPSMRYTDKILLMGSCFAADIGEKMQDHKLDVLLNPNGILFNPLSITRALQDYLDGTPVSQDQLFRHDGVWHSWQHHSSFSSPDPSEALEKINGARLSAGRRLEEADWLVITLGSAFVHVLKETNEIVANNHKVPAAAFYKRLLTAEEVITALDNAMHRLFFRNRKVRILFTVSPVRYTRDGVAENNLSKAILLQAVHHLVNKFDRLHYFPAYELVIDDLRDYRFYKEDLVHPNELAIQYVWEHFTAAALNEEGQALLKEVGEIVRASRHRPLHPGSEELQRFKDTYAEKALALQRAHPFLDMAKEMAYFNR